MIKRLFALFVVFTLFSNVATQAQTHTYSDPIILGYFPSWSESWASEGQNSKLREVPSHVNYVFLSFAKPDLLYTKGSYDISQTGIQVPYDGCTLKESVKALKDKGTYVILSVGGETYWNSSTIYSNINYQMIKDLVDDMGFVGIDWDFEPNGSFSNIGSTENVQHFIDFFNNSRALMPRSEGYILACAPSGVGALGGQTNNDASSTHAYANRNALTGESDANLYNSSAPTNGINLFGFSATGHMIPVIQAVGDKIDIIAYQGYNVGGSQNRKIMYDAYAYYAEQYDFKVVAGIHFPEEPWGPYYTYTHDNVADLSEHIYNHPTRAGERDGVMIWQLLLEGGGNSSYGYLNLASQILSGVAKPNAIASANNFSMETYSGGSEVNCFCDAPEPNLGADQNICGQSPYVLDTQVPVQSGVTFTWIKDGTSVVSSSTTQNTYTITDAGTYKVQVEKDGCSSDDIIVITKDVPKPTLGADASLCPDGSVTLNSNISESGYTFVWYKNGVLIPSGTANSYTATSEGEYSVYVERTGCSTSSDTTNVSSDMPAFDLGATSNLCSPATRTLSTGFTNPAYQYVWKKGGNVIAGATSSSYEVTTAGTYEVTVSAAGCNSQSDDVIITSSLPVGTNDTICVAGLANLVASEQVEWFDVETGGAALHTGTTYSPNVSSSTDYWISAGGSFQSYTTLRTVYQGDGWQQVPQVYGTKFMVHQELTLDEVTVNAEVGSVVINVVESDGTTVVATTSVPVATGLTNIPLNFTLSAGTYYLNAVGSVSNLLVDLTPDADYINTGVITVEGEAYWDWNSPSGANYVKSGHYGNFINLIYTVGSSCDRVKVQAIIDPNNPKCGGNPCAGKETYAQHVEEACKEYISPSGKIWTTSGAYQDTIPNAAGCDSIMFFQVTINDAIYQNITMEGCDSVISPSGKYVWKATGVYYDTLSTSNGCDSILEVSFTKYQSSETAIDIFGCNYATSPDGQHVWQNSGVYRDTLVSSQGCDSMMVYNVEIVQTLYHTIDSNACGEVVSPSGKYTWSASGTYVDTLTSVNGCDSVLTVNLSITDINVDVSIVGNTLEAEEVNAQYQWLDCTNAPPEIVGEIGKIFTPTTSGYYAVEISKNGCVATSDCQQITITGIGDLEEVQVSIYSTVQGDWLKWNSSENTELKVISINGKEVYKTSLLGVSKYPLPHSLESGLYVIHLKIGEEKSIVLRWMKNE